MIKVEARIGAKVGVQEITEVLVWLGTVVPLLSIIETLSAMFFYRVFHLALGYSGRISNKITIKIVVRAMTSTKIWYYCKKQKM